MNSLKKVVFKLMDEKGFCIDQDIYNLYTGNREINLNTVENYKTQFNKLNKIEE